MIESEKNFKLIRKQTHFDLDIGYNKDKRV